MLASDEEIQGHSYLPVVDRSRTISSMLHPPQGCRSRVQFSVPDSVIGHVRIPLRGEEKGREKKKDTDLEIRKNESVEEMDIAIPEIA